MSSPEQPDHTTPDRADYEAQVELIDYLRVIVHYRWVVVLGAVLFGAVAAFWPNYRSSLYPVQFVIMPTSAEDDIQSRNPYASRLARKAHYLDLIKSFPVAQRVARQQYQIQVNGQTVKGPLTTCLQALARASKGTSDQTASAADSQIVEANAALALQEMLTVDQQEAGIMEVTIQTQSPELTMQIAEAYIKSLREYDEYLRYQNTHAKMSLVKTRLDSVTHDLLAAEEKERRLLAHNSGLLGANKAFEIPELDLELKRVQRQVAAKSKLYDMLLQNYEMTRIEATSLTTAIEVLSPPTPLKNKQGLKRWMRIPIGFVLGGILSIWLALLLNYWKRNQDQGKTGFVSEALSRDWRRFTRILPASRSDN